MKYAIFNDLGWCVASGTKQTMTVIMRSWGKRPGWTMLRVR